jgi:ELWxxDGT repeat protein
MKPTGLWSAVMPASIHIPHAIDSTRRGGSFLPAIEELETRLTPAFVVLGDLNPNRFVISGPPAESCQAGGLTYFTRADIASGTELWRTDGTVSGTLLVRDINPGAAGSNPRGLVAIGGTVYFVADNGTVGAELWRTDGTVSGTALVRDINPGAAGSDPSGLANLNGTLLFTADDGARGRELWKSG